MDEPARLKVRVEKPKYAMRHTGMNDSILTDVSQQQPFKHSIYHAQEGGEGGESIIMTLVEIEEQQLSMFNQEHSYESLPEVRSSS